MERDGAVAAIGISQDLLVVTALCIDIVVPCIGVASGSVKFVIVGVVEGEVEGDGAIAAIGISQDLLS